MYTKMQTTLSIVISVTYYMKFCNAISSYCISHIFPKNVKLVVWTLIEN